nr:hypothetical protein [Nocardia abscessus]
MRIDRPRSAGSHVLLAATAMVCAFPIYWLFVTSLRRPEDVTSLSPIPWPISFANYGYAADKVDVPGLIGNTLFVAALSATGQLLIALLTRTRSRCTPSPSSGCCTWRSSAPGWCRSK